MQALEQIEIEIDQMSFGPAGVGRFTPPGAERGVVVFVDGALPGERVLAQITSKEKTYWEAVSIKVLKQSESRRIPPCPHFSTCGGCQWQHLNDDAQTLWKGKILLHQIFRSTKIPLESLKEKLHLHPSKNTFGYRTRVQLHGDEHGLGFFKKRSHQIAYADHCPILHPKLQAYWKTFLAEDRNREALALSRQSQFKLEWTLNNNTGIIQESLNQSHAALGFTQVNPEQNEVLQKIVLEAILFDKKEHSVLFDLYGGSGNLSLLASEHFLSTYCVDSHNQGMTLAQLDASKLNHKKAGFVKIESSTEQFLKSIRFSKIPKPEVIIADPPREGLKRTANLIRDLEARKIILVSCDPSTLARDLNTLLGKYDLEEIHFVDMFPQTFHIESVVVLKQRH